MRQESKTEKSVDDKNNLSKDDADKNVQKLARAVEKTYGNAWSIIWRNFLAGIMRAVGLAFGYVVVLGLLIFIAQKLGAFDALQRSWRSLTSSVSEFRQTMELVDPANMEQAELPFDPDDLDSFR